MDAGTPGQQGRTARCSACLTNMALVLRYRFVLPNVMTARKTGMRPRVAAGCCGRAGCSCKLERNAASRHLRRTCTSTSGGRIPSLPIYYYYSVFRRTVSLFAKALMLLFQGEGIGKHAMCVARGLILLQYDCGGMRTV